MAWGQSGGLGVDTAAADAYGGNRGEVETAGGIEMGGAAAAADLANALADALAGGDYYDPGAVAAQDIAAQEQDTMATEEGDAGIPGEFAFVDTSRPAYGTQGYSTSVGTGVEDFTGGGYANAPATSDLSFGAYGQQTQPSGDVLSPGEQGRVDAGGYQDILGSGAGLAKATQFDPTQQGHPDFQRSADIFGTGVESFAGMPGAVQAAPTSIEEVGMGMAAPIDSTSLNVGMITAATSPYGDPLNRVAKPGAITAGTTGPHVTEGTIRQEPEQNFTWFREPETYTDDYLAGTPAGTTTGTQAQISQDTNAVKQAAAQYVTPTQTTIDLEVQNTSARLDQEAAQKREQYGTFSKEYQKAQRIANAFKTLDAYSKSYASVHGKSFLGELLGGKFSLLGAIKSVEGWLQDKFGGKVPGETGEQLAAMLEEAYNKGTLNEVLRDLNQAGEGGMEAEMALQEEVSSFIQRYPWAAELDPKYIKYLIDNPAVLQDLLGQGPGGGDQAAPGNQTKPGGGGGGGSPPAGFTQKPGAATQALVEWSNPATGETWTAPNGSWQGPPGWVQV